MAIDDHTDLSPEDKKKAKLKAYYEANKEKIKARSRAHHAANRDEIRAKQKAFREANPELVKARKKADYEANGDKYRAIKKAHRQEHRDAYLARGQARRDAMTEEDKARTAEYMKAYREERGEDLLAKKREYQQVHRDEIATKKRAERQDGTRIIERERAWREKNREKLLNQSRIRGAANLEKRRADKAARIEEFREKWAKYKYGIGMSEILAMRTSQRDCCAICSTPFALLKHHIDHCHNSKKVRGLLCGNCNRSLGLMKDDTGIAKSVVRYLAHHQREEIAATAYDNPVRGTREYFATIRAVRESQGEHCAICSSRFGEKTPELDHCHRSGKVRAMLCKRCNMALGQINDDIKIAKRIIAYLKKHAA